MLLFSAIPSTHAPNAFQSENKEVYSGKTVKLVKFSDITCLQIQRGH